MTISLDLVISITSELSQTFLFKKKKDFEIKIKKLSIKYTISRHFRCHKVIQIVGFTRISEVSY